ncbi:MAG: conjugal transfer protein TraX [Lachnospiraceae bacterium]|nr:conjugal transfer protein TraX [Lachnospiraceae bacterium]
MSIFSLKMLACISMLIDHTGSVLYPQHMFLRYIGRLAFPIYCFMLVEGYHHTSDIRKYLTRLGIFAIISELPFDLALEGRLFYWGHQNVFFTLLLGLSMLFILDMVSELYLKVLVVASFACIAQEIHCDYRFMGILLIFFFEYFRHTPVMKGMMGVFCNTQLLSRAQGYGIFSLIPIAFYNGKKGPSMKYFFYAFYPAHLTVIYIIARMRNIY